MDGRRRRNGLIFHFVHARVSRAFLSCQLINDDNANDGE